MIKMTFGQAAATLGLKTVCSVQRTTDATLILSAEGFSLPVPQSELVTTHEQIEFQGIAIDTRKIKPGNLFVALRGTNVDGHDFLEEGRINGAAAALVTQKMPSSLPQLIVADCTVALGQLATTWRNQFNIPFIAVTGSNGKTTLKNMLTAILVSACQGDTSQVLSSLGNFNNQWGLPLTLANLTPQHRFAAIEMGMNHFGEIEYLTKMVKPNVAIITNAAAAHLEGVGDVAGVARAKSEIFLGLPQNGMAILNRDDAFFAYWREQVGNHQYLTFGFHPDADICLIENRAETMGQWIKCRTPVGYIDIHLPLLGHHNILNALAAIAATLAIGISLAPIQTGLENIQPAPGRLHCHQLSDQVNIIDDSYNANPFSLLAALQVLSTRPGKKILVFADMKELGEEANQFHIEAGRQIRAANIDFLFTFGELSARTAQAFGEGAFHFNEQEKLVNALRPFLQNQATILIKGSRSMHMEKVVAALLPT